MFCPLRFDGNKIASLLVADPAGAVADIRMMIDPLTGCPSELAKILLTVKKRGVLMQRTPTITWLSPFYAMMRYLPKRVITL